MNFLFNTFDQLEPLETFVFTDAAQTLTVTKQSGTFAAGAYVLRFKKGDLTLEDVALTYGANALTASNALDFLALEFELSRQNRVTLTCALLKDGAAYGGEGSFAAKNETEAVDFDPQLPVTRYESDSTLAEPTNFFTANASGIWDAISGLVEVPDTFDASTALHLGTTTGNLAGTTTIQDLADKVDALSQGDNLGNHAATQEIDLGGNPIINANYIALQDSYDLSNGILTANEGRLFFNDVLVITETNLAANLPAFDPETAAHGGTTTGNLTGTSTVADLADKVDALTLSAVSSSSKTYSLPFSYMQTTKCFTAGSLGWVTEEFNFDSCGGYESASATLQNGTSYLSFPLPAGATGFAATGLNLYLYANSTGTAADAKLDLTLFSTSGASRTIHASKTAHTLSTLNTPERLSFTGLTGALQSQRIVLEIENYSRNSKSIKLISGAWEFLG